MTATGTTDVPLHETRTAEPFEVAVLLEAPGSRRCMGIALGVRTERRLPARRRLRHGRLSSSFRAQPQSSIHDLLVAPADPVLLELVEQRAVADAEELRRVRAVPVHGVERFLDQARLERAPRAAEREIAARAASLAAHRGDEVRRQVREAEPVGAREDHRALEDVLELANVAGPVVGHEALQRLVVDAAHRLPEAAQAPPEEVV